MQENKPLDMQHDSFFFSTSSSFFHRPPAHAHTKTEWPFFTSQQEHTSLA